MPTVEQREQIIERVVQKTIKQVQLVSTTQNKIQGDFFEINELPVVNPKDIVLLRDMREYPLPYIESIDRLGKLEVRFSRRLADCTSPESCDALKAIFREKVVLQLHSGDTDDLLGSSGPPPAFNETSTDGRRLLEEQSTSSGMHDFDNFVAREDLIDWTIEAFNPDGFTARLRIEESDA